MTTRAGAYSTVLSPVLLMTIELSLDEKLDPLDLLPLLDPLDDEPETLGPVTLPEIEIPGPLDPADGAAPSPDSDDDFASLCVQTPSARYVFVPGTRIATVRTTPSMRSIASMRSSSSWPSVNVIR